MSDNVAKKPKLQQDQDEVEPKTTLIHGYLPNKNVAISSYDSRLRNDPGKTTLNLCLIWMRSNEKAEFVRRHKS